MYEKELAQIIQASENNALTFFVGAGVSALSGAPSWKELIDAINNKLGRPQKDKYSSDEYLQVPQMFYYSLNKDAEEYCQFIKSQLYSSDLKPNIIHREMLNLNPTSFITTNYDTLLEDASIDQCKSFKAISQDKDIPTIFGDKFILKLHGDFKNNNFVLKEEDYLNYSENFKLIETLAKSLFSTNTVVFIGYSLTDYNIKLIVNWAKTLLKDSFRKPIFLYTDAPALTDEELIYHQSKGLMVIECNKLNASADTYMDRYKSFFEALNRQISSALEGKSDDEVFDYLYKRLQPLNRLNALRTNDIAQQLYPNINIGYSGVIYNTQINNHLLKKFFIINKMSKSEQKRLTADELKKYHCILNVFKKARVLYVEDEQIYRRFIPDNQPLADQNCIMFNYSAMQAFSKKKYTSAKSNYKKAFYLFQLKRYDEAFILFSKVAKQSFEKKDYLLYYLAESNCINLRIVLKNLNTLYRCYDINTLTPTDLDIENLFRNLPVEFRNKYSSLKDIHSANMLCIYFLIIEFNQRKQTAVPTD